MRHIQSYRSDSTTADVQMCDTRVESLIGADVLEMIEQNETVAGSGKLESEDQYEDFSGYSQLGLVACQH